MVESTAVRLLEDFSLEMTGKDVGNLQEAASAIAPGTRINVTYLGNEDLPMRVAAAKAVGELGFTPVPHISARRVTSEQALRDFLAALAEVNATERVFVVGGDPATPEGPYPDSLSIIRTGILQEYGVREVSVAGYPEGHPDIDTATLWEHLRAKTASLAEQGLSQVVISQFAFDAERVSEWVAEVRDAGVTGDIRVGTPGPAGVKRLIGYAKRFGVGTSAGIIKKYGFSLANLVGTAGPDRFITELAADTQVAGDGRGVKTHFYTFGGLSATAEWIRDFSRGA
ncbi:methylenetetrahydrofolate reductase [Brevibacterium casei]|uniref:Methylenetetrahydrofolate reductase n=2 Tax=Brevibacterium casei TaxID=33889 RepID=A0A2H1HSP5_9MICO|nr:methylenetetrahydrofolate reductase [Brevibacterium casei]PAK95056.1 5,10-methylenetetrahydrofolate reductase [Brevibacterium casei]QPR38409.1 methylenetetrahydrofolate reductase [Brevibacterium casei]QPR42575.1 methylenetetrahydrofolate reductase [Brevibacterium casei]SMX65939.1 methylenetetrahydrofolate reductase (NADPH) [Brevibacterium casei CIP 102111]